MDLVAAPDQPTEAEFIKKLEDEHLRLQRQIRTTETDRDQKAMGVHPQFRRQDQLLRCLKREYINLVKDLKIARSGAHKKKDKRMRKDLKKGLILKMKTENDCEGQSTMMNQLEGMMKNNQKGIMQLRQLASTTKGALEERRIQSEQRLISTENKLEMAMLRFNAVQHENRQIREKIEHMLKDRALFNQAWSKIMATLSKGKKFMTDLFESSTLAYNQRDEWVNKLKSVQEKAKIDQMLQVQEMRDLKKAYDHEMKLYSFLGKKGVMRINKQQEARDEEAKVAAARIKTKQCEEHMKIIDKITDYAEESDVFRIIDTFERIEQENFATYKLVTDYCAENVVLEKDVEKLRQDLEDRRDWNEMKAAERVTKLKEVTDEYEERKSRADALRQAVREKDKLLNNIMEKIGELFKMLDCSLEPFENLLGDKKPTLNHLGLTMELMSEKIKENVETLYYYERTTKRDKSTSRLKLYTIHVEPPAVWNAAPIQVIVPADPCPACVEARWLSRLSDEPEYPFDKEAALAAVRELSEDIAFEWADRIHKLADCRVPRSRLIMAKQYMQSQH